MTLPRYGTQRTGQRQTGRPTFQMPQFGGGFGQQQMQAQPQPFQQPQVPTITPSQGVLPPLHSQSESQIALNNVRALTPEMGELIKQYDRPGVSRSAGNMARALGDMAGFKAREAEAALQIPFNASLANNRQLLQEQQNRESETLALASFLGQQQDQQASFQRNVLSQLLGSIFGMIGSS